MTGVAVVLLEQELAGPPAGAAFAAARAVGGDDVRTLVLAAAVPAGALPAVGSLEVGVLSSPGTAGGDTWFEGVTALLGEVPPPVVVFAAGALGDAVAARLAGALGYSPVVDVATLEVEAGEDGGGDGRQDGGGDGRQDGGGDGGVAGALVIERSAFGGKASHRLRALPTGLVLAMAGDGPAGDPPPEAVPPALVRRLTPAAGPLTATVHVPAAPAGLQAARVVVAGGRGVGESGFRLVEELARQLDAAVGASRAAVDAGWARPDQQVGLTGQTVAPDVYVAIGISGASQHLAGMSRSHVVLAVNTDGSAPMADAADVAFVADWHALWPSLEELLSSRMATTVPAAGER